MNNRCDRGPSLAEQHGELLELPDDAPQHRLRILLDLPRRETNDEPTNVTQRLLTTMIALEGSSIDGFVVIPLTLNLDHKSDVGERDVGKYIADGCRHPHVGDPAGETCLREQPMNRALRRRPRAGSDMSPRAGRSDAPSEA